MGAKLLVDALERLASAGASMRCSELEELLVSLGFDVRDGKRGGHKVFVHDHLEDFRSAAYNCGHGRNPEIKPAYIRNVRQVLIMHKEALNRFLEEK